MLSGKTKRAGFTWIFPCYRYREKGLCCDGGVSLVFRELAVFFRFYRGGIVLL
jgi:hypothetical protein